MDKDQMFATFLAEYYHVPPERQRFVRLNEGARLGGLGNVVIRTIPEGLGGGDEPPPPLDEFTTQQVRLVGGMFADSDWLDAWTIDFISFMVSPTHYMAEELGIDLGGSPRPVITWLAKADASPENVADFAKEVVASIAVFPVDVTTEVIGRILKKMPWLLALVGAGGIAGGYYLATK